MCHLLMCCTMHADRPKNQLHETDLWTKNDFKLMKKFQFFIKRFGDRLSDHYHRFPMYKWTKFDILARQEPTKAKSTWFLTKSHLIRNLNDVNCGVRPMVYQHINETVCIYIYLRRAIKLQLKVVWKLYWNRMKWIDE